MKKVRVNLNKRSYDILIGSGAVKKLPGLVKSMSLTGPVVLITDKIVQSKTSGVTREAFKRLPKNILKITLPATERSKSIKVFQGLIKKISEGTKMHRPLIVALGGGVVGDVAGFAAATYRRGVPLVHIPTTLLAQVDSSIGGKVGIDVPEAKNLIGAFYQPKAVLMDPVFLRTLPKRQLRNGLAEVIKYAIIKKTNLFNFLENNMEKILSLDEKAVERIVSECAAIKARVVEKDEFDNKDIRIALNFGHTLGHAIEAASNYSARYNHGESIAVGMILACEIALRLKMIKEKDLARIKALIKRAGLPSRIRGISAGDILKSHEYDKKFTKGSSRFVLPRGIGTTKVVENVPKPLIKAVIEKYAS